ncbi:MAG: helix-turn-helix domain-containing protein [Lachnospiraceae bacterium]
MPFFQIPGPYDLIEYINYYRIGAACDQLLSGSDPVSSIATGCGYSNISYFNRMFRKYMHCTPKEYRKAHSETPCKNGSGSLCPFLARLPPRWSRSAGENLPRHS